MLRSPPQRGHAQGRRADRRAGPHGRRRPPLPRAELARLRQLCPLALDTQPVGRRIARRLPLLAGRIALRHRSRRRLLATLLAKPLLAAIRRFGLRCRRCRRWLLLAGALLTHLALLLGHLALLLLLGNLALLPWCCRCHITHLLAEFASVLAEFARLPWCCR